MIQHFFYTLASLFIVTYYCSSQLQLFLLHLSNILQHLSQTIGSIMQII